MLVAVLLELGAHLARERRRRSSRGAALCRTVTHIALMWHGYRARASKQPSQLGMDVQTHRTW